MPGQKQSTLITALDAQKHEVRSHSIGVSQEGKRNGGKNLPEIKHSGSQSTANSASNFIKRLQKDKEDRIKVNKE